ncbi:LCP family protein [Marinicrinis lubricantis]|uniref:LCP family protein n=1 Tax=Marinicrinis lubricantis TaxID=2086470 RepID=A0ABW1IKF9_9BACL
MKTKLKKFALISLCVLVLLVIAVAWKINSSLDEMVVDSDRTLLNEETTQRIQDRDAVKQTVTVEEKPTDFYILLVGIDSRGNSLTLNTDSLIAAHVIPDTKTVKLVSIPRDLRVELSDGPAKINSVFASGYMQAVHIAREQPERLSGSKVTLGEIELPEEYITSGMVLARESVEEVLDIQIDHTFLVNFETVVSLVDAVGGIEVEVERSMHYDSQADDTHIHLEPGTHILNGRDALNYARFRQDNRGTAYYSNDFERGNRQQQVISALIDELTSWNSVTKMFDLLDQVSSNFKTDISKTKMMSMIRDYYGTFDSSSIHSIAVEGTWESPYVYIEETQMEQIRSQFASLDVLSDSPGSEQEASPSVTDMTLEAP